MRIGIIGKVLRHTWAIDERYALASGGIIAGLLSGNAMEDDADVSVENENAKPYAISFTAAGVGGRVKSYDDAAPGSVAVIPVLGPLMKDDEDNCGEINSGMATLGKRVAEADSHRNIGSIILYIDSPGGTVDGTKSFSDIILGTSKPVVAYVDGLMASAALWIGTSANHIVAENQTTEIGSIGVMLSFADMQPMWEQRGVKFHRIVSDLSKDKNKEYYDALEGNYDTIKNESLNPLAQMFIDAVKQNRGDKLSSDETFTGKVYFAQDALNLGLIDEIGPFDVAVERARSLSTNKLSNSKPKTNMKALPALCALLGVAALEATDEGVFLNEEQLDLIEARLANMERLQLDAQQANERANTAESNADTANSRITELESELEEARKRPGSDTSKVKVSTDKELETGAASKPVVSENDDILTAIDKVGKEYL